MHSERINNYIISVAKSLIERNVELGISVRGKQISSNSTIYIWASGRTQQPL